MSRLLDRPGYAWTLFFVVAGLLYWTTGDPKAPVIILGLEVILWTAIRQFKNWLRRAQ
jgi:hypothetical protein